MNLLFLKNWMLASLERQLCGKRNRKRNFFILTTSFLLFIIATFLVELPVNIWESADLNVKIESFEKCLSLGYMKIYLTLSPLRENAINLLGGNGRQTVKGHTFPGWEQPLHVPNNMKQENNLIILTNR